MQLEKVEAIPVLIKGKAGYDIRVNESSATVMDYIDAIDGFIEKNTCYRSRRPGQQSCFGCDFCCQERVPVTLVDALLLSDGDISDTVQKVFHVYVEGPVVDITLGLDGAGKCRFLEKTQGTCRIYPQRPLVCRTFICCPSTSRAKQLREEIVNTGEDELVRNWFRMSGAKGHIIHEAIEPAPQISDYPPTSFANAVRYDQVRLRDICSPELWENLRKLTVKPK